MIKPETPVKLMDKHDRLSTDLHLNLESIEATLELNGVSRPTLIEDAHETLEEVSTSLYAIQNILLYQRMALNPGFGPAHTPEMHRIKTLETELNLVAKTFEENMSLLYKALEMVKNHSNAVATSRAYLKELKENISATLEALYKTLQDRGVK